ncbi:hypothetical protein RFI_03640 [Reticulomyxa filosa]|uniref:Uncharacterized protein n=1 Tax=Reticulomyxa filosa TaxID=46433 RepID=X6P5S1_RETFI|nr:hypothetical protein RFI_03640 [Reticulomyxa filosa]|eukprot:ETO33468.1 hypothetical protein RFI_03640 [Reticulomyxa filosa]
MNEGILFFFNNLHCLSSFTFLFSYFFISELFISLIGNINNFKDMVLLLFIHFVNKNGIVQNSFCKKNILHKYFLWTSRRNVDIYGTITQLLKEHEKNMFCEYLDEINLGISEEYTNQIIQIFYEYLESVLEKLQCCGLKDVSDIIIEMLDFKMDLLMPEI